MATKQPYRGYLYVILSAVIYGCMPLMATYIYADGVTPMTLVFLRNALALPSLALLAFIQSKTLALPVRALPSLSLISLLGCCVTPILLFSSYRYIASGTATVLHFIYPAIVLLGGLIFLRKKAQLGSILSVLLCLIGICLFYVPGSDFSWTGALLALASGGTFAAYVLCLSVFRYKQVSGFLFSFYVATAGSVFTLILCLITRQLALPQTLGGWGLCLLFALLVTTGAVFLFQQGAFLIGGERASILSTLEPITGVFIGILLLGDPLHPQSIIGSVLVIAASLLIAVFDMRTKKSEQR